MPETIADFDPDFASASEWARMYRGYGMQVVPAKLPVKGGEWKMPALAKWKEWRRTFVPDAVFNGWYDGKIGEYRTHDNMGGICGGVSGRIVMIDLDIYKGSTALDWWLGVLAVHNNGSEPETWEQITGGGGRQLFFRYPEGWKATNASTDLNVDIRGNGGFAMLPPSLHTSGKHYDWVAGRAPYDIDICEAPAWLLEEVDRLIREHGGGKVAGDFDHDPVEPPQGRYDAFGHKTDGREDQMVRLIWAAVLDWHRERPDLPSDAEQRVRAAEKYLIYQDLVSARIVDPSKTKAELLDMETPQRGPAAFWEKWQYAMGKWAAEVAEEAAKPNPKPDEAAHGDGFANQQERVDPGTGKPLPIDWLDMSNWDNVPVPTRQWAIRDRVPLNQVGLFSGEGGTGKSIIELMKDVAHVASKEWLGSLPEQGGAFYLGAEDEADEIHIRLAAIAKYYGTTFKELVAGGLRVLPLLGKDSMLAVPVGRGNQIETTPLYRQLYEAAGDLKPKNISIDTLSRAFGGDEINRVQVYAFAMHMQALAKVAQGSVTILSHPSLSGMASGSGISGSTAWHGAFRFRQYLKGVRDAGEGDPADDDLRELEFKKNQYGPRGQPVILRYREGVFVPVNGATDPERVVREARADGLFVNLLRRVNGRGDRVTHLASSAHFYAPKVFAEEPEAKAGKFRKGELEEAMRRHMTSGRVLAESYGIPSRPQSKLILAPGT